MEKQSSEVNEDLSLRPRDFIPLFGAIEYSDRIHDYVHTNSPRYSSSNFTSGTIRATALILYNGLLMGGSFSALMAGLEKLI